jgi:hypothetical protein
MTLKNLLGISLDAVAPDKALVAKLLAAAQRSIAAECLASAQDLLLQVRTWLRDQRPDLL